MQKRIVYIFRRRQLHRVLLAWRGQADRSAWQGSMACQQRQHRERLVLSSICSAWWAFSHHMLNSCRAPQTLVMHVAIEVPAAYVTVLQHEIRTHAGCVLRFQVFDMTYTVMVVC